MTLQNKRSFTAGARPHLVSGEIAHNLTDDLLFFRYEGYLTGLDLTNLRFASLPQTGVQDAPLTYTSGGLKFDDEKAPASVVNGSVDVDPPPPSGQWAVPGELVLDAGQTVALGAGEARVETFFVASDSIRVNRVALRLATGFTGLLRLAIYDAEDTERFSASVTDPSAGLIEASAAATLPNGFHRLIVWTEAACDADGFRTARFGRGVSFSGGKARFIKDVYTQAVDFSTGIDPALLSPPAAPEADPLDTRCGLLRWLVN